MMRISRSVFLTIILTVLWAVPALAQRIDDIESARRQIEELRIEEAVSRLRSALERQERLSPRQLVRAYELLAEVFEISTSLRGETHPGTLMTMNSLGALLSDMGEQSQAETLLVDALAKARSAMPSGHTVITRLELQLADVYDAQGMHELAEPLFLEAVTSLRDQLGDTHPWTLRAVGQVVTHYRSRGMPEVAEQWESGDIGRP